MGFFKRKSDVFSSLIEGAEGVSIHQFLSRRLQKRLRRDKVAMVCLAVVVLIVAGRHFRPPSSPPTKRTTWTSATSCAGPSAEHWLGTDEFGRDVFTRIIYGSRVSLMVGLVAESIAVAIGLIVGAVAGFYGGKVDAVLSRIIEIFASFPHILFAIVVMFVSGHGNHQRLHRRRRRRLDRPGPRHPLADHAAQAEGICRSGARQRRAQYADHLPPPHSQLPVDHHRRRDHEHPLRHHVRSQPVLPGARVSSRRRPAGAR